MREAPGGGDADRAGVREAEIARSAGAQGAAGKESGASGAQARGDDVGANASEATREAEIPAGSERYVEEELPPDFWDQSPAPGGSAGESEAVSGRPASGSPSSDEGARVAPGRDGRPSDTTVKAPESGPLAHSLTAHDPAFAALAAIFPGRVIEVEAQEGEGASEGGEEPPPLPEATPDDETIEDDQERY